MAIVRNRHAAHVGGLAPGAVGEVTQEALQAAPWAFETLEAIPNQEPSEGPPRPSARAARAAIAESDDPEFVRQFVGDPRSSVHSRAVSRLRTLDRG